MDKGNKTNGDAKMLVSVDMMDLNESYGMQSEHLQHTGIATMRIHIDSHLKDQQNLDWLCEEFNSWSQPFPMYLTPYSREDMVLFMNYEDAHETVDFARIIDRIDNHIRNFCVAHDVMELHNEYDENNPTLDSHYANLSVLINLNCNRFITTAHFCERLHNDFAQWLDAFIPQMYYSTRNENYYGKISVTEFQRHPNNENDSRTLTFERTAEDPSELIIREHNNNPVLNVRVDMPREEIRRQLLESLRNLTHDRLVTPPPQFLGMGNPNQYNTYCPYTGWVYDSRDNNIPPTRSKIVYIPYKVMDTAKDNLLKILKIHDTYPNLNQLTSDELMKIPHLTGVEAGQLLHMFDEEKYITSTDELKQMGISNYTIDYILLNYDMKVPEGHVNRMYIYKHRYEREVNMYEDVQKKNNRKWIRLERAIEI